MRAAAYFNSATSISFKFAVTVNLTQVGDLLRLDHLKDISLRNHYMVARDSIFQPRAFEADHMPISQLFQDVVEFDQKPSILPAFASLFVPDPGSFTARMYQRLVLFLSYALSHAGSANHLRFEFLHSLKWLKSTSPCSLTRPSSLQARKISTKFLLLNLMSKSATAPRESFSTFLCQYPQHAKSRSVREHDQYTLRMYWAHPNHAYSSATKDTYGHLLKCRCKQGCQCSEYAGTPHHQLYVRWQVWNLCSDFLSLSVT